MPTGVKILLGILVGGGAGLALGIAEDMALVSASQTYAQCPGFAAYYSVGEVITARVIVALSAAAFVAGIWFATRGRPGVGTGLMTAAIVALLPATACGLGYALRAGTCGNS
jgi:hypothetical protein